MRKNNALLVVYNRYKHPPSTEKYPSDLPVWWLIILFLLLALSAQWNTDFASSNTFIKSCVAGIGTTSLLALSAWVCYSRTLKSAYIYVSPERTCFIALFALSGLSIFWAANIDFAITKWLLWLSASISFVLVLNLKLSARNLILLAWGLVVSGSIIAIVGILQHLTDGLISLPQSEPPASTFNNKNMAAKIIILVWPLSLFLLFSRPVKDKWTLLLGLCIALMLVYVYYTSTRSA